MCDHELESLEVSVYTNAPEMWVCYVRKEFTGSNVCGPRGHQRNVNDARWNVALEDTMRTQTRSRVWKAVFTADLGVNAFFTTSLVW